MTESVIIAIISLLGTLVGSYSGTRYSHKLMEYRIERLEEKLEMCNKLLERVSVVEAKLQKNVA